MDESGKGVRSVISPIGEKAARGTLATDSIRTTPAISAGYRLIRYAAEHVAVELPQLGGCLCGATRYSILEDPLIAYDCHCTDCQTASGSGFALCLTMRIAAIDMGRGSIERRTIAFPDGREWNFQVCGACETRLWSERRTTPEIVSVRAGTLDDASWVYPVAHIWVASALPWSPIPSESIRFPGQPASPMEMIRAWRERTPS